MITDKTVFILGAGASKPYGFPTALELRKEIIYTFPTQYVSEDAKLKGISHDQVNVDPLIIELVNTFKLSSTKSIDLFLSRNKRYLEVGKLLLTFLIGDYEAKSKFREDISNPSQDWYFEIFDVLTREISDPEKLTQVFVNNKITFITFNYDRSLEHFLYESFFNSFASKRNEIMQLMSSLKIIHVYGKLAPLPWEDPNYNFKYGKDDIYPVISDYLKNINIIYEERNEGSEDIKNEILAAKNIFILGFGYADENLKALDFSNLLKREHRIYGTGLGLTEKEMLRIAYRLKGANQNINIESIIIDNCDSVMLLRQYL